MKRESSRMVGKYTAVDLFCGAGGLSLGFKNAGYEDFSFKIIAAVDNWKPAVNTYKANHPEVKVIPWDIREKRVLDELVNITGGHVDTVIGGPPCEAFSLAGKRDPNDPRARLFYEYVKIVERLKPYMFVMENVKGILTMITLREDISHDEKQTALKVLNELLDLKSVGRKRRAAPQYVLRNNKFENPELQKKVDYVKSMITTVPEAIKQAFNNVGYDVAWRPLNAADYGVPQERERVFFIGARRGLDIKICFPEPTHSKEPKVEPTGRRLERWRTLRDAIGDLPPFEERVDDEIYNGGFSYIYMSRNRVMSWDKPSYTILASARHILLHPDSPPMIKIGRDERVFADSDKKPRRLSIRECARIQTFPDSYKFVGNTVIDKYALIGDAVPPLLAKRVAEAVLQSLVEAKVKPSE